MKSEDFGKCGTCRHWTRLRSWTGELGPWGHCGLELRPDDESIGNPRLWPCVVEDDTCPDYHRAPSALRGEE